MLKVLKLEDGRYNSPIIVLQFGLKIVLSMNVDSNTSFVCDQTSLLLYCILLCA